MSQWLKAAAAGDEEMVAKLLAARPELLNEGDDLGKTALYFATCNGHDRIVALLLAAGHPTHAVTFNNTTLLHHAASNGNGKTVALLLAASPDLIHATTHWGRTALFHAAELGHEKVFAQLLAACPQLIDVRDNGDLTVLHHAADKGRDSIVAQIVAQRPDLVAEESGGWIALQYAIRGGHESVAERLLAIRPETANVTFNATGSTLLHVAVTQPFSDEFVAKLWRMNPQALHVADMNGSQTPLSLAVLAAKHDLIERFQWSLSLDEIMSAFLINNDKAEAYQERYRSVVEQQCESLFFAVLNQDVAGTVFEYLGFEPVKRKRTKTTNQTPPFLLKPCLPKSEIG